MKTINTLIGCTFVLASGFATAQIPASEDRRESTSFQGNVHGEDTRPVPSSIASQPVAVSQVRIVRLSQAVGDVQMDRRTDQHFEAAFTNLPVVAGAALRTKQGVAEVEFEDNSSVRLTPESQVAFSRLGRESSGQTATTVDLIHGSLYVSLAGGKLNGDFAVNAGNQKIVLAPSSHLRLDFDAPTARMVVFQGSATITGPTGSLLVTKKKAISFDTASSAAPEFIHVADAGAYDKWDKNAVDYHSVRTVAAGFSGSSSSYSINDLSYYGSFSDVGGCGSMWRPYLANAAFDPYSSGVWTWYPGQGYSWVSLYPWGWAPFHSGSWSYCGAGGWGWSPQGNWNGLLNHPALMTLHGPVRGPVRPTPPPHAPLRGQPTIVAVNVTSLHSSQQGADGKFVFRNDSAGLGVPRGMFNNLSKISQRAETHGSIATTISEHQFSLGTIASSRATGVSNSTTGGSSMGRQNNGGVRSTAPSASSASSSHSVSSSPAATSVSSAGASHSSGGSSSSHH